MAIDPNKFKVYAERDVSKSQVNWADAAKTITSDIEKIRDERELKKAAIETATQATMKDLRKLEPVKNQQLGELALKGSNQSADYLMMQNTLLKNGHISPTDYMVGLQNQKDQWANFSAAVKNWNAADVVARERLNALDSSQMEWYMNEQNESFGNVNNIQTFIDPESGEMSIIQLDEDGQIPLLANGEPDRSAYMNVNSMNVRMNDQVDRVDLAQDIVPDVTAFATYIDSTWKGGYGSRVEQLEDARQAPAYQDYLTSIVKKYTADPRQVVSILADNEGGYTFTQDPNEQGGKVILLEPDSRGFLQPSLTDDQTAAAEKYIRTTIEGQIDHIEEKKGTLVEEGMTLEEKQALKQTPADDDTVEFSAANMRDIFSGSVQEGKSVGSAVVSMFNNTMPEGQTKIAAGGLQRTEDGFVFTLEDGERKIVNVFDDDGTTQLADDIIVQKIADALGVTDKNIRDTFNEQNVELGIFNKEGVFTTEKSEGELSQPRYLGPVDLTDEDGVGAEEFIIGALDETLDYRRNATDDEIISTFNSLITRFWNEESLGGVGLNIVGNVMEVTINNEPYTINIDRGGSPLILWDKLKEIESEARQKENAARSGSTSVDMG